MSIRDCKYGLKTNKIILKTQKKSIRKEIDETSFGRLLEWLDDDPSVSAEVYRRIHHKLILYFSARGCPGAEDLADETIDRVMLKINAEQIAYEGNPLKYFYSFAKHIHQEFLRSRNFQLNEDFLAATGETNFETTDEEESKLGKQLQKCLARFKAADRKLILEYYSAQSGREKEFREKVAAKYSLSPNSLRVKVFRLKNRLANCIEKRQN
jgi:DNA-directed RNA polymerase specialized sigma24 family protein